MNNPHFGTDEHMHSLYSEVLAEIVSNTRGAGVRTGRWWSIEEGAEHKLGKRGGDAMILAHMGVQKGWWPRYAASPMLASDVAKMPIGAPPAEGEDEERDEAGAGDGAASADVYGPDDKCMSASKARKRGCWATGRRRRLPLHCSHAL